MTVAELMELLSQIPADYEIVVGSGELVSGLRRQGAAADDGRKQLLLATNEYWIKPVREWQPLFKQGKPLEESV